MSDCIFAEAQAPAIVQAPGAVASGEQFRLRQVAPDEQVRHGGEAGAGQARGGPGEGEGGRGGGGIQATH